MTSYYTPFETDTSAVHAHIIWHVLKDCITCNIMCMRPHTIPNHVRYSHAHKVQGHYVVIRVSSLPLWRGPESEYYVLTTNIETKAAFGISVPVGRYPIPHVNTETAEENEDHRE
ncbi:hypothetical protein C8Q76DRAFT_802401 [Earliella scabrosa]|nr:hypothetical protein C8Q76DRAFT_802401 [Earliella scabrosa]